MIRSDPTASGEDATALAESAGRAVAMVWTLRRLRRQLRISRAGAGYAEPGAARHPLHDQSPEKG